MNKKISNLHFLHTVVTFGLILTGLILYSQFLRGILSSLRSYVRDIHIFAGILFIFSIVAYCVILTRTWGKISGQYDRKLMNLTAITLAVGLALTGILLLTYTDLQNSLDISALSLHRILAIIGIPAVFYHAVTGWFSITRQAGVDGPVSADKGFISSRRVFIRWTASAGALLSGLVLAKWFLFSKDTTLPGVKGKYKDCNKMDPLPVPSLGSVPPIGGGYKGNFEVFTVTQIPCATSAGWQFRVFGLVDNPLTLTWTKFLDIPRQVQVSDFYCITGWTVTHCTFEGIPLSRLLTLAGLQPNAKYVKFYSSDGVYTSALSLEQALMKDVMVAVLIDGEAIPSDLGGPARLIIPQMYAYKGVKWLNAIELIQEPHIGYWESRGYANDAWVK
ncbi:molybdopterin-dependent oxidoreductase [Sporomusa sp.]|uniref:molybdopterin-dependent oxidoreductase n=1 Tax=Sporomusa sp. TaxID=2078658 RepID=UPI002B943383|nr:molybdopterin-dependent oxidoreductase [Sporomusa sp.]HWR44140.1 molybdopterin-dependent oxidoreductase [Sporomusa sp.]